MRKNRFADYNTNKPLIHLLSCTRWPAGCKLSDFMLSKAAVLMLPHNVVDVDSIKTAALDSDNVNLQPAGQRPHNKSFNLTSNVMPIAYSILMPFLQVTS